jgi:hypothetical protein
MPRHPAPVGRPRQLLPLERRGAEGKGGGEPKGRGGRGPAASDVPSTSGAFCRRVERAAWQIWPKSASRRIGPHPCGTAPERSRSRSRDGEGEKGLGLQRFALQRQRRASLAQTRRRLATTRRPFQHRASPSAYCLCAIAFAAGLPQLRARRSYCPQFTVHTALCKHNGRTAVMSCGRADARPPEAVVSACTKFSYDCHMRCVVLPGAADGPVRSTVFALHGAWRRVGRCHAQWAHASPSFDHSESEGRPCAYSPIV